MVCGRLLGSALAETDRQAGGRSDQPNLPFSRDVLHGGWAGGQAGGRAGRNGLSGLAERVEWAGGRVCCVFGDGVFACDSTVGAGMLSTHSVLRNTPFQHQHLGVNGRTVGDWRRRRTYMRLVLRGVFVQIPFMRYHSAPMLSFSRGWFLGE